MLEGKIIDSGNYTLQESERGRLMLILKNEFTYIWLTENNIHKLMYTKGVSPKSGDKHFREIRSGTFYIINRSNNTKYPGLTHLYLKHETHFDEYIIKNGLPDISTEDKEIFPTHRIIAADELETFALQKI